MNTLIEPTTRNHPTGSEYSEQLIEDSHIVDKYAYQQRSSSEMTGTACETATKKKSANMRKRLLAPSKPPMRLEGKRRHGKTSISFCA